MRPLHLILLTLLVCGLVGCSRSQKFGGAISAQDVARAMPEFTLVMPPGASNVYLQSFSQSPVSLVYLKLSVPRASLTNFLTASGLNAMLLPVPPGAFSSKLMPLPQGLNPAGAVNYIADVRHAEAWDPGKGNTPLLMGSVTAQAKSSPREQVMLLLLLDDSLSPQAKVYLQVRPRPQTPLIPPAQSILPLESGPWTSKSRFSFAPKVGTLAFSL